MASSQIEVASSSPFRCVLRDHNRSKENSACFPRKMIRAYVIDENFHHGQAHVEKDSKKMDIQHKKPRCSLHVSDIMQNDDIDESCCCTSQSQRENVTCVDENDEISNLAASSLVQIWEARLRRSSSNGDACYSRSNSGCSDNGSSLVDEDVKVDEYVENVDEGKCDDQKVERDDSMSRKSGRLDSLEIERVRVADIVKRWSSGDNESESFSPGNSPLMRFCRCDQGDQTVFPPVVKGSPRIRGRQAFNDLLMLLERDRHRELEALANRHVVSKFPQKGRIQSMLRLKVLQRGLAAKVQVQSQDRPSTDRKRPSQGSQIMLLRERFKMGVETGTTATREELNPKSTQKESLNSNQLKSSPASKLSEDHCLEETCILTKSGERFQAGDDKGTALPVNRVNPQSQEETTSRNTQHKYEISSAGPMEEESCDENVITNEKQSRSPLEHMVQPFVKDIVEEPNSSLEVICQEPCSEAYRDDPVHCWQETSWDSGIFGPEDNAPEVMYLNDWEENEESEVDNDQLMEFNYDWISDIARPRSYWEECRQARYQEVLSTDSSKEEIRRLLERGTVSNFLTSDLRDRIDQLMESRLQVTYQASIQDEEDSQERMELTMRSLQRDKHSIGTDEEGRDRDQDQVKQSEAEGEVENLVNHRQHKVSEEIENIVCQQGDAYSGEVTIVERLTCQRQGVMDNADDKMEDAEEVAIIDYIDEYQETNDYFDQARSPFQMRTPSQSSSWSYQVCEAGETSDQVVSSTSNPHLHSESCYQNTRHTTSCRNRSSIEMELINDLREKMETLQQEILELRRSINFCLDVQLEMQQSFKQEVNQATMDGENGLSKRRRKGRCCICNETQIDCLLYRCGHMCTCLKCANELQWSSGKCPICQAPIDDVVKTSSCS